MRSLFTMTLTAVLAAAPGMVTMMPHRYSAAATAGIAFCGALYHLWQGTPADE